MAGPGRAKPLWQEVSKGAEPHGATACPQTTTHLRTRATSQSPQGLFHAQTEPDLAVSLVASGIQGTRQPPLCRTLHITLQHQNSLPSLRGLESKHSGRFLSSQILSRVIPDQPHNSQQRTKVQVALSPWSLPWLGRPSCRRADPEHSRGGAALMGREDPAHPSSPCVLGALPWAAALGLLSVLWPQAGRGVSPDPSPRGSAPQNWGAPSISRWATALLLPPPLEAPVSGGLGEGNARAGGRGSAHPKDSPPEEGCRGPEGRVEFGSRVCTPFSRSQGLPHSSGD